MSTIIQTLTQKGNHIYLLFDRLWSKEWSPHIVDKFVENSDTIEVEWSLQRNDFWRNIIFPSRELRSYISYLKRPDQSKYYLKRWRKYLPSFLKKRVKSKFYRRIYNLPPIRILLENFEKIVPPDKKICKDLIQKKPDVVVITPMNMRFSEEIEYTKAANHLNIPTIVPVYSWDNLTTKGLFHIIPDLTLVWNKVQRQEAIAIHAVPDDKILITGSPFFDKWFNSDHMKENRFDFCRRIGLDPDKPFILYLGSSINIAKDETWLIEEIYNRIKSNKDSRIRELRILVRPHPAHSKHYARLENKDIVVWPKEGALPEEENSQRDFLNMLCHSILTIGINTSGMIDAVINKKPCLTIMTEQYLTTQQQALHFKHLLKADVLEVTHSPQEAIVAIQNIMEGRDRHRDQRIQFVKDFVRPCGLQQEAGKVAALAIELTAKGKSVSEIRSLLHV
jgi:hypothetical protein